MELPLSEQDLLDCIRRRHPGVVALRARELRRDTVGKSKWQVWFVNLTIELEGGGERLIPLVFKWLDYQPEAELLGNFGFMHHEASTSVFVRQAGLIAAPYVYAAHAPVEPGPRWLLSEFVEGRDPREYWWVGTTLVEQARDALDAVAEHARLHARTWGQEVALARSCPWLLRFNPANELEVFDQTLVSLRGLETCGRMADLTGRWLPALRRSRSKFAALMLELDRCPRVLAHGDPRGSYIMRDTPPPGEPKVVFFDFEKCQISPACLDFDLLYAPSGEVDDRAVEVYRRALAEEKGLRPPEHEWRRWLRWGRYPRFASRLVGGLLRTAWAHSAGSPRELAVALYLGDELAQLCAFLERE